MQIEGPTPVLEKVWKPNQKGQQQVLSMPDSIFEGLGGGAAGGGKTDLVIMIPPYRQFVEHPKYKCLVMRRTLTDLEKEIVPRQQEWYAPMGAVYNENKKRWRFPSGALVQNGHAEKEQDVRHYDTAEYNNILWEESTHFSGFQYRYLSLSRCRSSSPDLPAFVRAFTNPGNIGHKFFKDRFVSPHKPGCVTLKDGKTGIKRMYIPFLGKDNPHLLRNDPGYLSRLEGLPEAEKRAKLFGDWDSYEGQVFSEYRILRLPGEPENALHVIPPAKIPSFWPRILCIDWGYAAMTFAIWAAIAPNGRIYVYRTYDWRQKLINIWTKDIVNMSGDEVYDDVVICHSAGQRKGEERTIRDQVKDAFGDKYEVRLAERDRIGGKTLLHEYLRWEQRPRLAPEDITYDNEVAMRILRMQGEDKYEEYLQLFKPIIKEDNLPKLRIFTHSVDYNGVIMQRLNEKEELLPCTNNLLIDTIPACVPDETNPEDVQQFDGDDPYDTLRMVVKAAAGLSEESANRLQATEKLEQLHALNTPESQTAYYMALEKSKSEDSEIISVPRHRTVGYHKNTVSRA